MVIIRMPLPPKMVGSLHIPDAARDLAQHNVMAGRVVAMGPLAFQYKDGSGGLSRQDVKIGDWVVIRPFAGTMLQGGKLYESGGWRYVSSFQDVIATVPADKMPDPSTLTWEDTDLHAQPAAPAAEPKVDEYAGSVRERIIYEKG
jgi:co-chaperonin GroES (HSP10)